MTERRRDLFTGALLVALAIAWTAIVWRTIPGGTGGGDIGPRAFPLLLGLLLGLCSLGFVAKALWQPRGADAMAAPDDEETAARETSATASIGSLVLTLGHIVAYGFLMQAIGFVLSTALIVVSVMVLCIGERKLWRIAAMSVGVTFVCWLVFGKILGVYLAVGTWINLG